MGCIFVHAKHRGMKKLIAIIVVILALTVIIGFIICFFYVMPILKAELSFRQGIAAIIMYYSVLFWLGFTFGKLIYWADHF